MVRSLLRLGLAALALTLLAVRPVPAATYVTPILLPQTFQFSLTPLPPHFDAVRIGTTAGPITVSTIAGELPGLVSTPRQVTGTFLSPSTAQFARVGLGGFGPTATGPTFGTIFGPATTGSAVTISAPYTFSPTVSSLSNSSPSPYVLSATAGISSNATTNPNPTFTLYGASAGPVFQGTWSGAGTSNNTAAGPSGSVVTPGSTGGAEFGVLKPGEVAAQTLTIANASTDADRTVVNFLGFPIVNALVGNAADLTIKDIKIEGPNAVDFYLDPAEVAALIGTVLNPGDSLPLTVFFNPTLGIPFGEWTGPKVAYLNIYTDQFGALGGDNQVFSYQLNGTFVPEPSTVTALALGLGGLALVRRRRGRPARG